MQKNININDDPFLFQRQPLHEGSALSTSTSSQGTPYHGTHPFPYSESPSVIPQLNPRGLVADYQPLYNIADGRFRGSHMNQGNMSSDPPSLHSMVAQVTSKVHQLTENSSQQMTQNAMFNTYLQKLSERLDAAEQRIAHLEAAEQRVETLHNEMSELTEKMKPPKKAATKNISNDHPILKVIQTTKININKDSQMSHSPSFIQFSSRCVV